MNSFGTLFKVQIFGESHGDCVGVLIDGCPAGIALQQSHFVEDMERRKGGKQKGTTPRQEDDILSELRFSYLAQGDYHRMLSDYLKYYSLDNFLIINFESEIANGLELTRIRIADFLDIDLSNLDLDLHSNKSGKPRFSFLQKIMMKNGFWRQALKFCFSSITRQIIRNKIKNFNKINHDFMPLTQQIKIELYKKYFMEDVLSLEKLLNRNMFWSNL